MNPKTHPEFYKKETTGGKEIPRFVVFTGAYEHVGGELHAKFRFWSNADVTPRFTHLSRTTLEEQRKLLIATQFPYHQTQRALDNWPV